MYIFLFVLIAIPGVLLITDFFIYLFRRKRFFNRWLDLIAAVLYVIVLPVLYMHLFDLEANDCCTSSAVFSPEHRLTAYILIGICVVNYFYAFFKRKIFSPVVEVISNAILLGGIVFNIFLGIHIIGDFGRIGNPPIILLFLYQFLRNHYVFKNTFPLVDQIEGSGLIKWSWQLIHSPIWIKMPVMMVLGVPLLFVVMGVLMFFGQKPDSFIRMFTETYKHGLSQWNYKCEGVVCGGHYLCSIAANGHARIVNPLRTGERHGKTIVCNRQLLISNAFEEWISERSPALHSVIRHHYDRIGDTIHNHYDFFQHRIICDGIYLLMKPLEWLFLAVLYTVELNPEKRIVRQYLPASIKNQ